MRRICHLSVILFLLLTCAVTPASAAREPKLLSEGEARYPHAIRLSDGDIVASVDLWGDGGGIAEIYRSTNGASFRKVGTIKDPEAARGLCCAHLFELPQRVGDMPKGTLLWAGSVGRNYGQMMMRIWRSPNRGATWSYLSTCGTSPNSGGVWEPDLSVDASGKLVCHFADESFPGHSQALVRTTSTDGITWSDKAFTVAVSPRGYRPGMAHVRKLPTGEYLMTYEICGQRGQYFCEAFFRISADGANWGDPADHGTRMHSSDGRYFAHTPTVVLAENGTAAGRLVLIGQMLMSHDGKVDPGNGATLFVSDHGPAGPWVEAPAPVPVPSARDVNCPNYHPTLVASEDGRKVLELASDFNANGLCQVRFATGPLPLRP